jgi:hypothetical protein
MFRRNLRIAGLAAKQLFGYLADRRGQRSEARPRAEGRRAGRCGRR